MEEVYREYTESEAEFERACRKRERAYGALRRAAQDDVLQFALEKLKDEDAKVTVEEDGTLKITMAAADAVEQIQGKALNARLYPDAYVRSVLAQKRRKK